MHRRTHVKTLKRTRILPGLPELPARGIGRFSLWRRSIRHSLACRCLISGSSRASDAWCRARRCSRSRASRRRADRLRCGPTALGCSDSRVLGVAVRERRAACQVAGALLVAGVPDPAEAHFPQDAVGFAPITARAPAVRESIVVASTDTTRTAACRSLKACAKAWGQPAGSTITARAGTSMPTADSVTGRTRATGWRRSASEHESAWPPPKSVNARQPR